MPGPGRRWSPRPSPRTIDHTTSRALPWPSAPYRRLGAGHSGLYSRPGALRLSFSVTGGHRDLGDLAYLVTAVGDDVVLAPTQRWPAYIRWAERALGLRAKDVSDSRSVIGPIGLASIDDRFGDCAVGLLNNTSLILTDCSRYRRTVSDIGFLRILPFPAKALPGPRYKTT
jgi:hypothetical protein